MIIRTSRNSYLVIGYMGQEGQTETCLCENMSDHRRCLMVRLKDPAQITDSVGFLYQQADNQAFTDFEECTVDEESLLLVFSYPQGRPLNEKLEGEYSSMAERLHLVENVLEKIILQNMPPYFAARCLRPEAVWARRSLEVDFLYDTAGVERGNDFGMREVQEVFKGLLRLVFDEELKKETIPPMEELLRWMDRAVFDGYMELFRQFRETADRILALSEEELKMPKTWIFRLWDRIRKLFKPLKKIAALILLVVALAYMIWTVRSSMQPAASSDIIRQIGTLTISE